MKLLIYREKKTKENNTVSPKLNRTTAQSSRISMGYITGAVYIRTKLSIMKISENLKKKNLCSYETVLIFSSFKLPPTTLTKERES